MGGRTAPRRLGPCPATAQSTGATWLVICQPNSIRIAGKTPMPDGKEWRTLIEVIPTGAVRGPRHRALAEGDGLHMRGHHLRADKPPSCGQMDSPTDSADNWKAH